MHRIIGWSRFYFNFFFLRLKKRSWLLQSWKVNILALGVIAINWSDCIRYRFQVAVWLIYHLIWSSASVAHWHQNTKPNRSIEYQIAARKSTQSIFKFAFNTKRCVQCYSTHTCVQAHTNSVAYAYTVHTCTIAHLSKLLNGVQFM